MVWAFCRDAETFLQQRRAYLSANESLNCLCWAAIQRSNRALGYSNLNLLASWSAALSLASQGETSTGCCDALAS